MQTGATLSDLMKLYDYDLFENIVLPNGVDNSILVNQILLDCGLYEVLYPQHDFLKGQIENFFQAQLFNFTKVFEALSDEYNPLHNYDRYEDKNETRKLTSENTVNGNGTTEEKVSAFDSTTYQPSGQNTAQNSQSGNSQDEETYKTTNHLYGNIGVTTSQQMLEAEISLRNKWNIYQFISTKFFDTFMVKCL